MKNLPCSQDYDLWIRLSKEFLFECVPEPLFKYRIHQNKISTNLEALTKGSEIMARKYRDYPLSYYREQDVDIGIMYCLAGDVHKGRTAFLKTIKLFPFHVRAYFNFCVSLLGAETFRKLKEAERKILVSCTSMKRA